MTPVGPRDCPVQGDPSPAPGLSRPDLGRSRGDPDPTSRPACLRPRTPELRPATAATPRGAGPSCPPLGFLEPSSPSVHPSGPRTPSDVRARPKGAKRPPSVKRRTLVPDERHCKGGKRRPTREMGGSCLTTSAARLEATPFASQAKPSPRVARPLPAVPPPNPPRARSTAQAQAGAERGGVPGRAGHPQGKPATHARAGRRAPCRSPSGRVLQLPRVAGAPSPLRRPSSCQQWSPQPPGGQSRAGSRGRGPRERAARRPSPPGC